MIKIFLLTVIYLSIYISYNYSYEINDIKNNINIDNNSNDNGNISGYTHKNKIIYDFEKIKYIDTECLEYYDKNVARLHSRYHNNIISFSEYLEYYWNLEETDEELVKRVCDDMYIKYPIRHIRFRNK